MQTVSKPYTSSHWIWGGGSVQNIVLYTCLCSWSPHRQQQTMVVSPGQELWPYSSPWHPIKRSLSSAIQPLTAVGPRHDSILLPDQQCCRAPAQGVRRSSIRGPGLPCHQSTGWEEGPGGRPALNRALSLWNSTQDVLEELVNGFHYCTALDERKGHRATDTIRCWTEVRAGPQGSPHPAPEMTRERPEPTLKSGDSAGRLSVLSHQGPWTSASPTSYAGGRKTVLTHVQEH